jgi:hypothetical protein
MESVMKSNLLGKYLLVVFLYTVSYIDASDAFEQHCVPCHKQMNISLQKTFMKALLVYGGKENMKAGLAYYFKNPHINTSVMDEEFIQKNGIKQPIEIDQEQLEEALDIYWKRYTVIGKLQ